MQLYELSFQQLETLGIGQGLKPVYVLALGDERKSFVQGCEISCSEPTLLEKGLGSFRVEVELMIVHHVADTPAGLQVLLDNLELAVDN